MIIIALSIGNKAEWLLVDGCNVVEQAVTEGLNPFFMSRRDISHAIRLNLPEGFFRRRWDNVYFYGSGCANPEKNKIVESSLVAQFRSPSIVHSNLVGAARGLLIHEPGLVCILSLGSAAGLYDGDIITRNVVSGGYILGDEGSIVYMAKNFISDVLKQIAPEHIINDFYETYGTTAANILNEAYASQGLINSTLPKYATYLADHIGESYCHDIVYSAFQAFFRRNLAQFDYEKYGISVTGTAAETFSDVFMEAAEDFGVHVHKVDPSPMPGLIQYHKTRGETRGETRR